MKPTLNYHHLRYFWTVAREGGLVPAARVLQVSHPTVSAQIHALEEQLGEKLFDRPGRKLVLTELGRVVVRYADDIFAMGQEMVDVVQQAKLRTERLDVGIADVVPKLVVHRLLQPALALDPPVRLVCVEESHDTLLTQLANHKLDVIISDAPVPAGSTIRAFNHRLGETSVSLLGTDAFAKRYRSGFPQSLEAAPLLMPLEGLPLRRALDRWFAQHGIEPTIVAEFEDSALFKVFGSDGVGMFPTPTIIAKEVCAQYNVRVIAELPDVVEQFYVITMDRRIVHPAIRAITDQARARVFDHA